MRRQNEENQSRRALNLETSFSNVGELDIELEFVSLEGHTLGNETRHYKSSDSVNFTAPCLGRCGNGIINFEEKVSSTINASAEYREASQICQELIHVGAKDVCNCELRFKISVSYL